MATLADVAAQWDADGFDIYFLNDEVHARNCTVRGRHVLVLSHIQADAC